MEKEVKQIKTNHERQREIEIKVNKTKDIDVSVELLYESMRMMKDEVKNILQSRIMKD